MATPELIERLTNCPKGNQGWREFEDICIEIIRFLFVPPLSRLRIQSRTLSGIERRDAIAANRNLNNNTIWGQLRSELDARFVLFEFKNFERKKISVKEVDQIRNYLNPNIGRLGMIICPQPPSKNALRKRNMIYNNVNEKKVILFLNPDNLKEMLFIKERGEDPADLIMDGVEDFYLQVE